MQLDKNDRCNNCSSKNTFISENGYMAPFFMKRVHKIHLASFSEFVEDRLKLIRSKTLNKFISFFYFNLKRLKLLHPLFYFRSPGKTTIKVCIDCSFIGTCYPYSNEELASLYHDYRSDSYNAERVYFEPYYEKLKNLVGKSTDEIDFRIKNVDDIIGNFVDLAKVESILDWGGGEGRFIPSKLRDKKVFIFDVSNEPSISNEYVKIDRIGETDKYDYIQACHVLEHVANPHEVVSQMIGNLNQGGYLYIEVPQDRDELLINDFVSSRKNFYHILHEHLNLYTTKSTSRLGESLGLTPLCVYSRSRKINGYPVTIISGLFLKK